MLNGANAAALRFGVAGDWEVVQFRPPSWSRRANIAWAACCAARRAPTASMPEVWPAGTDFVLLDGAVRQLDLPASARGLERHYRVGPAVRAYDDPSYVHRVEAFAGVGLRPYRPAHFGAGVARMAAIELAWTRRTRIDGDSWLGTEVPLGEEREAYSCG